jgi:hypothetical protein
VTIEPFVTFISITETSLKFQPTSVLNIGDYSIFIKLTDPLKAFSQYSLDFKVRSPPYFAGKLAEKLDIIANNEFKYQLPVSGNRDEYVAHDSTLASFIQFTFPEYIFNASKISDLGFITIKGKL